MLVAPTAFAKKTEPVAPTGERKPVSERKRQEQIYFFHEGKKRATFGDIDNAAYCFRRAIKSDPYCDACYYELASLAAAGKQLDEALSYSRSAYVLDTANVWYSLRLAQLLALAGKLELAASYYEKTLALNPKLQEAYGELLLIYDKQGEYDKGVKTIALYQQNFGVDEVSLFSKQGFLFKQGKVKEAIAEAKTLTEMYPSEQQHWLLLAELYGADGADSLSLKAMGSAKTLDSTSVKYLLGMSDYYRRVSDFDSYFATLHSLFSSKAMPAITKLQMLEFLLQFPAIEQSYVTTIDSLYSLARVPYSYAVELTYSKFLIQTQRVNRAIGTLKLMTERGAYDAYLLDVIKNKQASKFFAGYALESVAYYEGWSLFFDLLISAQAWANVLTEADTYAGIFPNQYRPFYFKGLAYFQQKNYGEAIRFWQQAERAAGTSDTAFCAQLYASLGDAFFIQKEYSKADKYFTRSLKLQPNNILVLNNYAYYLSLRKTKLKKALAMSKAAVEAEPDNATYLDTYGWILYEMGDYAEAKKIFQRAMVNGGNEEPVILEHYGDVLHALKELSNAHIYWERAREKGNKSPELLEKLKRKE